MRKLFVAVLPYSESEKYVVGLTGKNGLQTSVLLGDLVGWEANFYEIKGLKTRAETDELAKKIIDNAGKGVLRVTGTDEEDKFELADFVVHATKV